MHTVPMYDIAKPSVILSIWSKQLCESHTHFSLVACKCGENEQGKQPRGISPDSDDFSGNGDNDVDIQSRQYKPTSRRCHRVQSANHLRVSGLLGRASHSRMINMSSRKVASVEVIRASFEGCRSQHETSASMHRTSDMESLCRSYSRGAEQHWKVA